MAGMSAASAVPTAAMVARRRSFMVKVKGRGSCSCLLPTSYVVWYTSTYLYVRNTTSNNCMYIICRYVVVCGTWYLDTTAWYLPPMVPYIGPGGTYKKSPNPLATALAKSHHRKFASKNSKKKLNIAHHSSSETKHRRLCFRSPTHTQPYNVIITIVKTAESNGEVGGSRYVECDGEIGRYSNTIVLLLISTLWCLYTTDGNK